MNSNIFNIKTIIAWILPVILFVTGCDDDDSFWDGTDYYIASFQIELNSTTYNATISSDSITIKVPGNVSLNGATATVKTSENATIDPDPSDITDWNNDQTFTVTAYNGSSQTYYYSVIQTGVTGSGDIVLTTQEEVEAFAARGISELHGSLTIGASEGEDSISSLALLTDLKIITSKLVINPTFSGTSLKGLENLEQVGSLKIGAVTKIDEVAFPALKSIVSDLTITSSKITSLSFPVLENVDNSVTLERNDSIAQLDFSSLKSVANDFIIMGWANDSKLNSISLPALESVQGELKFYYLYQLISVSMPEITTAGSVNIYANPVLESISLPKLEEAFKDVKIYSLALLTSLDLSSLSEVGGDLYLQSLPLVGHVECLKSLTSVGGIFTLNYLPLVSDLSPLASFTGAEEVVLGVGTQSFSELKSFKYAESLTITGNGSDVETIDVSNIEGLTYLRIENISSLFTLKGPEVFNGTLRIQTSNYNLEGFQEVDNILFYDFSTSSEIGDKEVASIKKVNEDFYVGATNMSGTYKFTGLEYVGGTLTIACQVPVEMPALKEVGELYSKLYALEEVILDLPALEKVNGDCNIATSYTTGLQLADINLPSLTTVEGLLTIAGYRSYLPNTELTNLDGFSSLTNVENLVIQHNSVLADYSGLEHAISSLSSTTCTITGNAYNPGYESLAAGKWTPED